MKITKILQQLKRLDRYSVFVDEAYAFSLSEIALLDSGLSRGQELTVPELADFKQLSLDDKVFGQALRYIAMRQHSTWEMQQYLQRKAAAPALVEQIITKLTQIGLLDDYEYAARFAQNRRLLRSSSKRKIIAELKQKRLPDGAISAALSGEPDEERSALSEMIIRKRRQTNYQDDTKLMQYLARQGFGYGDIKQALKADNYDD